MCRVYRSVCVCAWLRWNNRSILRSAICVPHLLCFDCSLIGPFLVLFWLFSLRENCFSNSVCSVSERVFTMKYFRDLRRRMKMLVCEWAASSGFDIKHGKRSPIIHEEKKGSTKIVVLQCVECVWALGGSSCVCMCVCSGKSGEPRSTRIYMYYFPKNP